MKPSGFAGRKMLGRSMISLISGSFRTLGTVLLLISLGGGCAASERQQDELDSASSYGGLFDEDPVLARLAVDAGQLGTGVCYRPNIDRYSFPGPAIPSITGAAPLKFIERGEAGECDVVVANASEATSDHGQTIVTDPTCTISIGPRQQVNVTTLEGKNGENRKRPELSCLLRIALYLEGFTGTLRMPYGALFMPASESMQFASRSNFDGPVVTEMPTKLAQKCPGIKRHYFNAENLKRFVADNNCLDSRPTDG